MRVLRGLSLIIFLAASLAIPATASAQWSFTFYIGSQHTASTTVSIDQPSLNTALDFHDVTFVGKPLKWPPYYGGRVQWLTSTGRFGIEAEFLHSKVYSVTAAQIHVTGTLDGNAVDGTISMDAIVQRYNMTHGHCFIFGNVVMRQPLYDRGGAHEIALVLRGGAGPAFQGVDSVVRFVSVQRTAEWQGAGGQAAAGVNLHLGGRLSAEVEYKMTFVRPTISVYAGSGTMTARTQQVTVGAMVRLSR
jgi:hypothetical protein